MLYLLEDGTIRLTRGDTAAFTINITNEVTDEVYNMASDDTLTMSVKKKAKNSEMCFSKTVVGTNKILIEPSDTKGLDFGKYVYDVELVTSSGGTSTIIEPTTFELLPEVTW